MLEWGPTENGVVPVLLDGRPVAAVDPEFWREGAQVTIADQTWEFTRDGSDRVARLSSPRGDAPVVLRARRKGLLHSAWLVEGDGRHYEIGPENFWGSTHRVLQDGRRIGTAGKVGFWSPRPTLDIDPSVPPLHQLFLLWVSRIIRRRAASAAAAG